MTLILFIINIFLMLIAENLKVLRRKSGLSIRKLALKAGVSPEYLSLLESEKIKNPGIKFLSALASALETSLDDLTKNKAISS